MFRKGNNRSLSDKGISGLMSLISAIIVFILAASGCGGDGGAGLSLGDGVSQDNPVQSAPIMDEPRSVSLEEALAEVDSLPTPLDIDVGLFEQLRSELKRVLSEQGVSRLASAAADGERNKVQHLAPIASSLEGISFVWRERNCGDYNLDGEVSAADLTPLGQRYAERLDDGDSDAWDQRIDGNEDGEIGIGDITPIGMNYLRRVSGYNVYRNAPGTGVFEPVGTVTRETAQFIPRSGWVYSFSDSLPDDRVSAYTYEVRPVTAQGEGVPSQRLTVYPGSSLGMGAGQAEALAVTVNDRVSHAVAGELLLTVGREWSTADVLELVYGGLGGVLLGKITGQPAYRVLFPQRGRDIRKVLEHHQALSQPSYHLYYDFLAFAHEITARSVSQTYSDPGYSLQYGLADIGAETAWDYHEGSGVVIGVVDSGFTVDHEDLQGRLSGYWRINPTAAEVQQGLEGEDFRGHGTLVSGVMVMNGGNSRGGVGLASDATVAMCKAGSWTLVDGGLDWTFPTSQIADGIEILIDEGVDVINLSLGGNAVCPILSSAVADALANDIVVVASAGNDNEENPSYPAHYPGVIAVGATDINRDRWESDADSGSNYGDWVTICAPGSGIYSTANDGSYSNFTGTSLSAPFVSAAAALLRGYYPAMSALSVQTVLLNTATWIPTDEPIGELLQIGAALQYSMTDPEIVVSPLSFLEHCDMEESGSVSFTIENTGDLDLIWTAAFYGTDTGLNVTLDDYAGTVAGGDTQEIEIAYTAPNFGGTFETEVHITSNDDDESLVVAEFMLYVTEPEIEVSALQLNLELDRGDRETGYVTVSNTGSGVLVVEETHAGDYLDAGFSVLQLPGTPVEVEPGHSVDLAVSVDTTMLLGGNIDGSYQGAVHIASNDVDEPLTSVYVDYVIHDSTNGAEMSIDTSPLDVELAPGATGSVFLTISNIGTSDLDYSVVPNSPSFTMCPMPGGPLAPGAGFDVEVIITAPNIEGSYNGSLEVMSMEFMPRNFSVPVNLAVTERDEQ